MEFVVLFIIVAIACLICRNGKRRIPRFCACTVFFVTTQILIGLRNINYAGADTQVYARDFVRIASSGYSFLDFFTYFYKDFGYYLFAGVVSFFTDNFNAFVFISALPYTIAVTWLIYRYSENIYLSMMMFLSLGFYLYDFQLMRHVFALGMIIVSFKFLQEGRDKVFLAVVALATFCHAIACIFFLAYFFRKGSITLKQFAWVVSGCIAVFVLSYQSSLSYFFNLLSFFISDRFVQYETRGGQFSSDFIIQLGLVLISFYYIKCHPELCRVANFAKIKMQDMNTRQKHKFSIKNIKFVPDNVNTILLFNMATISIVLYSMTNVIGEFYRVAQYFSIFTIILVPNTLSWAKDKKVSIAIMIVITLFCFKHFFGGLLVDGSDYYPYKFFWEGVQSLY